MEEERKFMNYQIGEKVNKWTILDLHKNKWSKKSALCECECGNTSEIELSRLKNNKQCRDCYNKERKDNSIIDIVEYKKYWNINNKYGIDKVVYDKMLYDCNRKCNICDKIMETNTSTQGQGINTVCIDHDHNTDKIRGLLCSACNKGLGHFNDDIEILKKAIEYLNNYNEKFSNNSEDR